MSRVVAVLGPILREASRDLEAAGPLPPLPGDLADLQLRSRSLSDAIEPLTRKLVEAMAGADRSDPLKAQIELLGQLARGLVAVVAGQPEDRDVVSSLRPLRSLAYKIDQSISRSRLPAAVRDEWKNVQTQIDELAAVFRLPREIIVSTSPTKPAPGGTELITIIDAALRAIEAMEGPGPAAVSRRSPAPVAGDDALSLRVRLLVLRQQLVGGEPNSRITQSLGAAETARRRLGDRLNRPAGDRTSSGTAALKKVDEAVTLVRGRLIKGH